MSEPPTVLVVHHTVSPATSAVHEAALEGLSLEELGDLRIVSLPALTAGAHDTLTASGVLVLSPVNIGYLAGAVKHYFDQIYYPCLDATKQLPCAVVLHANNDASGAMRATQAITGGMGWNLIADPLVISGEPDAAARAQISELASTLGAYAADLV